MHSMSLCVIPDYEGACMKLNSAPAEVDSKIQEVLGTYADVFDVHVELPPNRSHDHRIPLVDDANACEH